MFSWPRFGVKVIAVINCYSKREWGRPRLLQTLADTNKHSVLGKPKTPVFAEFSLELSIFLLHFQAQSTGEIA